MRTALGMGGTRAGSRYERVRRSGRARQEPGGSPHRAELRDAIGDRRAAGQGPGVGLSLRGKPTRPAQRLGLAAWPKACGQAVRGGIGEPCPPGFERVRVHDLKHTFGRRLRAAGVALETRKVLLGHRNGDITTHYSAPELQELIEAAERVSEARRGAQQLVVLRGSRGEKANPHKIPTEQNHVVGTKLSSV